MLTGRQLADALLDADPDGGAGNPALIRSAAEIARRHGDPAYAYKLSEDADNWTRYLAQTANQMRDCNAKAERRERFENTVAKLQAVRDMLARFDSWIDSNLQSANSVGLDDDEMSAIDGIIAGDNDLDNLHEIFPAA